MNVKSEVMSCIEILVTKYALEMRMRLHVTFQLSRGRKRVKAHEAMDVIPPLKMFLRVGVAEVPSKEIWLLVRYWAMWTIARIESRVLSTARVMDFYGMGL